MQWKRERVLVKRCTLFQITVAGLLLFCLGLQIATLVALQRTRAEARPLVSRSDALVELADQGPYIREALVMGLLSLAADELAGLAQSRLHYTVHISQTVPFSTAIAINERFAVPVSLVISQTLPVEAAIPFQGEVLVPVSLEIDQVFAIDTTVPFQDEIVVPVDDVIHIDERFRVRLLGQDFTVPIRGDIPVQLDVTVPIDKEFPVQADIPVAFPISETLPVEIDWTIPVDLELPVRLPVETEVSVPFSRIIPINVQVPLVLDVPLDIAIGETPFGQYLLALSEQLRRVAQEDR
jgi:hypothetical protein